MYREFEVFVKNKQGNLVHVLVSLWNRVSVEGKYIKPENFTELKKSPGYTGCSITMQDYDVEISRYAVMSPDDDNLYLKSGMSRAFHRAYEDAPKVFRNLPQESIDVIGEAYRDFIENVEDEKIVLQEDSDEDTFESW